MKILVAVEMKHPDSPILVTQVHMKTPKTESENTRAAMAFLELQEQVIEQSVKVTKYQVEGKKKKLKSIRCPHCKFNYTRDGMMSTLLDRKLVKNKGTAEIIRCSDCKELYLVSKKESFYTMEW